LKIIRLDLEIPENIYEEIQSRVTILDKVNSKDNTFNDVMLILISLGIVSFDKLNRVVDTDNAEGYRR
jgi:hypothetical protein